MKNSRLNLAAVLISGLMLISCQKNNDKVYLAPAATDNPLVSEIDKSIDTNFKPYIENTNHIGLSIAVIDGENTYFYNYGETHKGNNTLPSANSLYEIGSNTKTFTAAVVTRWMLENDISADTPINDLLPSDFPSISFQGKMIELEHLLNHTSGLPRVPGDMESYAGFDATNPYGNHDYEKLINFFKSYQLKKLPGSEYEYSNLGYLLLSRIVEYQYGVPIGAQIDSFITNPLGMPNTHMNLSQIVGSNPNVMGAYDHNGNTSKYWTWSIWEGVGAQYSNLVDLEKYARAHFKSFKSNTELKEVMAINAANNYSNGTFGVGRAWHIANINGTDLISHAGGTGGFGSAICIQPGQEKAIIILGNNFNSAGTLQGLGLTFMQDFLK